MPNVFEEYAVIAAQIEALEKKKDDLRPKIIEEMASQGMKKIETSVGNFSISKRKKFTYPQRITDMEEEVKAEKALAESTGEAVFEEVDSMRFVSTKL